MGCAPSNHSKQSKPRESTAFSAPESGVKTVVPNESGPYVACDVSGKGGARTADDSLARDGTDHVLPPADNGALNAAAIDLDVARDIYNKLQQVGPPSSFSYMLKVLIRQGG